PDPLRVFFVLRVLRIKVWREPIHRGSSTRGQPTLITYCSPPRHQDLISGRSGTHRFDWKSLCAASLLLEFEFLGEQRANPAVHSAKLCLPSFSSAYTEWCRETLR
ncbi:unnamed protein product, partial [Chrysoparadoxa australica]